MLNRFQVYYPYLFYELFLERNLILDPLPFPKSQSRYYLCHFFQWFFLKFHQLRLSAGPLGRQN